MLKGTGIILTDVSKTKDKLLKSLHFNVFSEGHISAEIYLSMNDR